MSPDDLEFVCKVAHVRSGAAIDSAKSYMIETRLAPLARRDGFVDLGAYVQAMRERRDEPMMWAVTDALTHGETSFFRDREPFARFRDEILPRLVAHRDRPLRIWSAACATGQEPYSLAMVLDEAVATVPGLRADLFASDLSERRIEKAQSGLFTQFEIQRGLPIRQLVRHFEKVDEAWKISDKIRAGIHWRRINLLADLRALGQFDVIFCRNVVSMLDPSLRAKVLEQMARALPDDGWLVLGRDETAEGVTEALEPIDGWTGVFARSPKFRAAA